MITDELAKELRQGGFPNIQAVQHRQGRQFLTPDGQLAIYSLGEIAPADDWFIPTLEELIEACGDEFLELFRHRTQEFVSYKWIAYSNNTRSGIGSTAEEAIARLWLTLYANRGSTI